MEPLIVDIIRPVIANLGYAVVTFAIIAFSRRKKRQFTPLRGLAIFTIGWLGGCLLIFAFLLLFAVVGSELLAGQLESQISILVSLAVMYAAFERLSQARFAGPQE